jgi:hypothetical protein
LLYDEETLKKRRERLKTKQVSFTLTRCAAEFKGGVEILVGEVSLFCWGEISNPCKDICFHLLLLFVRCWTVWLIVDAGEVISVVDDVICSFFGSVFSLIIWIRERKK